MSIIESGFLQTRQRKQNYKSTRQWTPAKCEKFVKGFCVDKTIAQRSEHAESMSDRGIDLEKPIFGKAKKRNVFGH